MDSKSHYQKYRTTILQSAKKWVEKNRQKWNSDLQYRNQLYKYSYKKINELIESGVLKKSVLDQIIKDTDENIQKLRLNK